MCRINITKDLAEKVSLLIKDNSNSEIAGRLRVSVTTVKRIIRENRLTRTKEELENIRSRTRKELIRAERRRAIFGLDQKTDIKVFTNRERNSLKYCLKRRKYLFLKRGETTAYYNEQTNRYPPYEERGRKLGIKFKRIETITQ